MGDLTRAGYILCLIGGIFGLVVGVIMLGVALVLGLVFSLTNTGTEGALGGLIIGGIYGFLGVLFTVSSIFVIISARWIKNPQTQKRGAIVAIVLSFFGGGGVISLVGGILALVDSQKK